ncbi:uncharacterized protein LOC131435689 [Malaya genurostris]|uniref:uncharacterized protein LOC131435689 n=1 Tax=Malaya genurostris TaxID=325434 RepID=UPI0026F3A741|nr:uncharacterized protein LOC131435689 [Malaya genurostris]
MEFVSNPNGHCRLCTKKDRALVEMLRCVDCDRWFHSSCVGLDERPPRPEAWYCAKCQKRNDEYAAMTKDLEVTNMALQAKIGSSRAIIELMRIHERTMLSLVTSIQNTGMKEDAMSVNSGNSIEWKSYYETLPKIIGNARGMEQQPKLHRYDMLQPSTTGGTTGITITTGSEENTSDSEELECDSNENDFAGFDEDAAGSENGMLSSPRSSSTISDFTNSEKVQELEANLWSSTEAFGENVVASVRSATLGSTDEQNKMESVVGMAPAPGNAFDNNAKVLAMSTMVTKRKVTAPVNALDEAFSVPFEYEWKRELVYYAKLDGNSKDTNNYIIMPLHGGLTSDNFTFKKDSVGGSSDEKIIRSAKSYGLTPRRSLNSLPIPEPLPGNNLGKLLKETSSPPCVSLVCASVSRSGTTPSLRSNSQTPPESREIRTGSQATFVCRMRNQVANHLRLWKNVRLKNSLVNDWTELEDIFKKKKRHKVFKHQIYRCQGILCLEKSMQRLIF